MEGFDEAVITFLAHLQDIDQHPSRQFLSEILRPVLEHEASIRNTPSFDSPSSVGCVNMYRGLFDIFCIPSNIRRVHAREENTPLTTEAQLALAKAEGGDATRFSYYSEAARALCSLPREYLFPLRRSLFRQTGDPSMVENLAVFQENLRIFTHGALAPITNWSNIVITGGAVVASLAGRSTVDGAVYTPAEINAFFQADAYYGQSGVDIMLYGLTPEQAIAKTEEIFSSLSASALWPLTVVRKADRISFHTLYPCRPIHVHLNVYASPADLLARCDIDCSCCIYNGMFVPGAPPPSNIPTALNRVGETVYMNPRALVAFMRQTNTIDLSLWSPSYEVRLAKYAIRGFEVHVPFLDREKVAYNRIYNRDLEELPSESVARLLVLEVLDGIPDHLHAINKLEDEGANARLDPSILASVERRVAGDGDMYWDHIPYGPDWNDMAIQIFIKTLNEGMNPPDSDRQLGRGTLHRHPAYASNQLADCLDTSYCKSCAIHITGRERERARDQRSLYLQGLLTFYPIDQQMRLFLILGNTESERRVEWIQGAYLGRAETPGDACFRVIPRRLWGQLALGVPVPPVYRAKVYIDVEGVVPTLLSPADVSSALDELTREFEAEADQPGDLTIALEQLPREVRAEAGAEMEVWSVEDFDRSFEESESEWDYEEGSNLDLNYQPAD